MPKDNEGYTWKVLEWREEEDIYYVLGEGSADTYELASIQAMERYKRLKEADFKS